MGPTYLAAFAALAVLIVTGPTGAEDQGIGNSALDIAIEAHHGGAFEEAARLMAPLAENGLPEAQYYLGFQYGQGLGVEQDQVAAHDWYERAAMQGHVRAQNNLGLMYFEGIGTPRDFQKAFVYFDLAASHGSDEAVGNRLIVARKMTSEQIALAQQAARDMLALMQQPTFQPSPIRLAAGVVINGGGYVLTHALAVADCPDLRVRRTIGSHAPEIVYLDPFDTVALLRVPADGAEGIAFRQGPLDDDQQLQIWGFRFADEFAVELDVHDTSVIASGALTELDDRYLQLAEALPPTVLGAPALDPEGRLVGLVDTAISPAAIAKVIDRTAISTTFAIRRDVLKLVLELTDVPFAETAEGSGAVAPDPTPNVVTVECWKAPEQAAEGAEFDESVGIN